MYHRDLDAKPSRAQLVDRGLNEDGAPVVQERAMPAGVRVPAAFHVLGCGNARADDPLDVTVHGGS